jgi:hypothetical protein
MSPQHDGRWEYRIMAVFFLSLSFAAVCAGVYLLSLIFFH